MKETINFFPKRTKNIILVKNKFLSSCVTLIRPTQIILPPWSQSPNTGAKTITTLANPRNTIKGSFAHALPQN